MESIARFHNTVWRLASEGWRTDSFNPPGLRSLAAGVPRPTEISRSLRNTIPSFELSSERRRRSGTSRDTTAVPTHSSAAKNNLVGKLTTLSDTLYQPS